MILMTLHNPHLIRNISTEFISIDGTLPWLTDLSSRNRFLNVSLPSSGRYELAYELLYLKAIIFSQQNITSGTVHIYQITIGTCSVLTNFG